MTIENHRRKQPRLSPADEIEKYALILRISGYKKGLQASLKI
jgi:hypothetical protein